MVRTRRQNYPIRSPEEGPTSRAGPRGSGGSGHNASDQWRGNLRGPRRGEGDVLDPEQVSAFQPQAGTSRRRIRQVTTRSSDASPAQSVLREPIVSSQPSTTRAGLPRQRMLWSDDMNICVMRNYYLITETNTGLPYRRELHRRFMEAYPELQVSEQRVADQRRAILANNLIPEVVLRSLRVEAIHELRRTGNTEVNELDNRFTLEFDDNENTQERNEETDLIFGGSNVQGDPMIEQVNTSQRIEESLRDELRSSWIKYGSNAPNLRPKLPRLKNHKKLNSTCAIMNEKVLPGFIQEHCNSIKDMHSAIYCAAFAVNRVLEVPIPEANPRFMEFSQVEPWERRLNIQIEALRREIAVLLAFKRTGTPSRRLQRRVNKILQQSSEENRTVDNVLDRAKQKLAALCQRRRRYLLSKNRRLNNRLFEKDEGLFYKKYDPAGKRKQEPAGVTLEAEDAVSYWSNIWEQDDDHNAQAPWIEEEQAKMDMIEDMPLPTFSSEDIGRICRGLVNWKAPGIDNIHNYWLKRLTCTYQKLGEFFSEMIRNPETVPEFFMEGRTTLIWKKGEPSNPANYRPITCLCTMYKLFTACVANAIEEHCRQHSIVDTAQNGSRKQSQGCKELLIMDSVAMGQAIKSRRNLHMAYIDLQKAYDSIPHSWLIKVLQLYKVNPTLVAMLTSVMSRWRTSVYLPTGELAGSIRVSNGIFQGDTLSPLWFCLALNPLSTQLRDAGGGFEVKGVRASEFMEHLLYMDDIKLLASTERKLRWLIDLVKRFADDIRMKFGMDKCKEVHIVKGKLVSPYGDLQQPVFRSMEPGDHYRYLGVQQARGIDHSQIKKEVTADFRRRVKWLLESGLNGRNVVKAINTFAVPVLTYSFGVIRWSLTDIRALQRTLRVMMRRSRYRHPQSAVERDILPRDIGGRGLTDLQSLWSRQVTALRRYFFEKRQALGGIFAVVCEADDGLTPLKLNDENFHLNEVSQTELDRNWSQKANHGRHWKKLHENHVDIEASNKWLKEGSLFAETEGSVLAIQDNVIKTRNYRKYIIKESGLVDDSCRLCGGKPETTDHIIASCPTLSQTAYLQRHNDVAKIIHQTLAHQHGLTCSSVPYYKYVPPEVLESDQWTLYWDRTVTTDRTIAHNRPDIIMVNKAQKKSWLIDISVPLAHNILTVAAHKREKYGDLAFEIKRLWGMEEVSIVPFVLSAEGIIPKTIHDSIRELGLPQNVYIEAQKAVLLNTSRIVRKFLGE